MAWQHTTTWSHYIKKKYIYTFCIKDFLGFLCQSSLKEQNFDKHKSSIFSKCNCPLKKNAVNVKGCTFLGRQPAVLFITPFNYLFFFSFLKQIKSIFLRCRHLIRLLKLPSHPTNNLLVLTFFNLSGRPGLFVSQALCTQSIFLCWFNMRDEPWSLVPKGLYEYFVWPYWTYLKCWKTFLGFFNLLGNF